MNRAIITGITGQDGAYLAELLLSKGEALTFQSISPQPPVNMSPDHAIKEKNVLGLDELFIRHVKKVLSMCNGKIHGPGGAAELLKINPSTLRNRMKKMGIPSGWEK